MTPWKPLRLVKIKIPKFKRPEIVRLVPDGISKFGTVCRIQHNKLLESRYSHDVEIEKINQSIQSTRLVVGLPTIDDYLISMNRPTNIMHPKDAMFILSLLRIGKNSQILECGSGSGSLSCLVAPLLKGFNASWHSVEYVPNHYFNAVQNFYEWSTHLDGGIDNFEPENLYPLLQEDISRIYQLHIDNPMNRRPSVASQLKSDLPADLSIQVKPCTFYLSSLGNFLNSTTASFDSVVLDVMDAELYLDQILRVMTVFGRVVIYTPSITQAVDVMKVVDSLKSHNYETELSLIGVYETSYRTWKLKHVEVDANTKYICRPEFGGNQIQHTGFLSVFEKIPRFS